MLSVRKRMLLLPAFAALLVAAPCFGAEPAARDPVMTVFRDALLAQLEKLETAVPDMTRSAEAAADKLLAGGNIYSGGQDAFATEAYYQVGGLMMLEPLTDKTPLTEKDVLLVGAWADDDEAALSACRRGKEAGAYVVLFSPAFKEPPPPLAGLCAAHVVNFALPAGAPIPGTDAKRSLPTSPIFDVTALWTWTGELIGACTRKGKMPVLWESVVLPGGRDRNKKYRVKGPPPHFHEDTTVPPQKPGELAHKYLDAMRREVGGLCGVVLDELADAGVLAAKAARAGGAVYLVTISHFTVYAAQPPRLPAWVHPSAWKMKPEGLAAVKPGDVYLELGYFQLRAPFVEAVRKAGGKSVVALCHSPVVPLDGPQPDILIDAQWDYGDAAVLLPGYDVKILPPSAVLQTAIFWTVTAKAEAELMVP